jgi:2-polyprenyl-3-methyl-5-hydroxy-6-metoxy-1,4-benzoquinol methylase
VRRFSRRGLRRLLKPLGKVKLTTDQPFRWLTMYVDKPRSSRRRPNRTCLNRFKVTARLCRGRVIELGCGEGNLTSRIRDRQLDVTGVDISRAKIRRAREEHPDIPFLQEDIRKLELPAEEFDTVVIAEVLEHVNEKVGTEILAKAWSLLKPGGRLIVSVPNEDCVPHPRHVREFDIRGLRRLLKAFGRPTIVTDQPFKWLMMYVEKN